MQLDVSIALHDVLVWLLTPLSGSPHHFIETAIAWHGRLMVAAWLVLIPLAVLIARFYKVTPAQDWPKVLNNPFWFIWHRGLGFLAASLIVIALAAILLRDDRQLRIPSIHAIAGWTTVLLGLLQIVNALLRGTHGGPIHPLTGGKGPRDLWPGDHYNMSRRRIVFEYQHKLAGYVALPLSLIAIASGLSAADAPRWMWLGLIATCALFACMFVRLQRQGRCIDTYQAIWGADPSLPGNRRATVIGWGIRRIAARGRPPDRSAGP